MPADRANNFDALRLTGALLVLFSHQFGLLGLREPMVYPGLSFGGFGVAMFFSISGYLITMSWLADPDAHRFIQRRFLRIWPAMAAVIVLSSCFLFIVTPANVWALLHYLTNLVWLDSSRGGAFFPSNVERQLYGSMWTLPLEVKCYALLLAAGMIFRRRLGAVATAVAAAALFTEVVREHVPGLISQLETHGWRWPIGVYGAFFLAGCVICFHQPLRDRPWVPILGGAFLMVRGHHLFGLLFALPLAVVWIGTRSWPVLRHAGRFGDLSYGIYLWAWPVQQTLAMWLGKSVSVWTHMALSLVITVAFAYTSWHLIEKRALALKPRRRDRAAVPMATAESAPPSQPPAWLSRHRVGADAGVAGDASCVSR